MSTNCVSNAEDADMADCDGEKIVTMMDVLQEQQDFEDDANAVLGASDDKNCTYSKGYIKRQAIYACLTCCSGVKEDPTKRAGVCLACSLNCHENHELIELYTKRNFRCDCGNPQFNSQPCQYTPNKSDLNVDNMYNQNFAGIYCTCHRPYPDPENTDEDEMIQCIICEDWLHASHLEAVIPGNDQYSEMICKACMDNNEFLHDYSNLAVNIIDTGDVDITAVNSIDIKHGNGDILTVEIPLNREIPEKNIAEIPANIDIDESSVKTSVNENGPNAEDQQYEEPVKDDAPNTSKDIELENKEIEQSLSDESNNVSEEDLKEMDASKGVENKEETSEENNSSENIEQMTTETTEPSTTLKSNENNTETGEETGNLNKDCKQSLDLIEGNNGNSKIVESENDKLSNELVVADQKRNGDANEEMIEDAKETISTENGENENKINIQQYEAPVKDDAPNTSKDIELENKKTEESLQDQSNNVSKEDVKEMATSEGVENKEETSEENNSSENIEQMTTETTEPSTTLKSNENNTETGEETGNLNKDCKQSLDLIQDNNGKSKIVELENYKLSKESVVANGDANEEMTEVPKEMILTEDGKYEDKINIKSEEIKENKRKLTAEDVIHDTAAKKTKLDNKLKCLRPNGVKRMQKGAVFWPSDFRQKLCTCGECLSMYKDLNVLFLIDAEDTVLAYETLGKERVDGRATQYEKGLEALSSLDRIQQINAISEYNKMKDKFIDYLKKFKERKEIVKEEDIRAFFAKLKPQGNLTDGVYFCR